MLHLFIVLSEKSWKHGSKKKIKAFPSLFVYPTTTSGTQQLENKSKPEDNVRHCMWWRKRWRSLRLWKVCFLRTPTKLLEWGGGRTTPFYSIDDKHSHPSNVFRGCKILYPHTFKVGIRKNAHWHSSDKKKRKERILLINGIKMGRLISACVRFVFYS